MSLIETGYNLTPSPSIPTLLFPVSSKPLPSHISLFLTEINRLLSGQIFDETWYTWWHLALTIYPDDHSQNQ